MITSFHRSHKMKLFYNFLNYGVKSGLNNVTSFRSLKYINFGSFFKISFHLIIFCATKSKDWQVFVHQTPTAKWDENQTKIKQIQIPRIEGSLLSNS